jgi:hypothetical protein
MEDTNSVNHSNEGKSPYTRFVLMLAGSFIAMYITMYFNTYEADHVYFSLTRFLYGLFRDFCHGGDHAVVYVKYAQE